MARDGRSDFEVAEVGEYCATVSGYVGFAPDLSDAGDRMNPAEIAARNYSGAENMPSYRGNLKPEELESLLAFLTSRDREQLPKPPALQGCSGKERQMAADNPPFDEDS